MRSYRQYCALAVALDAIGDRWSLLIVRELLIRGPCRYTDLKESLPGIASNMLADRLQHLERTEIIRRVQSPAPTLIALLDLTDRGRELEPIVLQLGYWGAPRLELTDRSYTFRSHWIVLPARLYLKDHTPRKPAETIELRVDDDSIAILIEKGSVTVRPGKVVAPNAVLAGPPRALLSILKGCVDLKTATSKGVRFSGNPQVLRRVQPAAVKSRTACANQRPRRSASACRPSG